LESGGKETPSTVKRKKEDNEKKDNGKRRQKVGLGVCIKWYLRYYSPVAPPHVKQEKAGKKKKLPLRSLSHHPLFSQREIPRFLPANNDDRRVGKNRKGSAHGLTKAHAEA
jgi:hypothetical protein